MEKLERDVGQYDEQSIVLNGTSKAEELAELYGAQLRITANGRFATLILPEGTVFINEGRTLFYTQMFRNCE